MNLDNLLNEILCRPIAFHRIFASIAGGATQGLFLSQAYYWCFRTNDLDGWFYKIREEWEKETALNRREQEGARKGLVKLGILETKKEGIPCKLFYRVNLSRLTQLIAEFTGSNPHGCQFAQNVQTRRSETYKQEGAKRTNKKAQNVQTILYTENTSETTLSSLPPHASKPPKENKRESEDEKYLGFQIPEEESSSQLLASHENQISLTEAIKSEVGVIVPVAAIAQIKKIQYDPALGIRPPRQRPKYLYPDGPWLNAEGQINEDFIRDRANLWRTGDNVNSKGFGAMAYEDVMGYVAGHYQKSQNHAKLEIDWQAYVSKNQRYVSNVQSRLDTGIKISEDEQQKILQKAPAMLAQAIEPAYGISDIKSTGALLPQANFDSMEENQTKVAKSELTKNLEQKNLFPEGAEDAAMYSRTAKPQDADYFRQMHEKAVAQRESQLILALGNIETASEQIAQLAESKGMSELSIEERDWIREQEKSYGKLAYWNSLLQTGIPSVVADVERQAAAQGYEIMDGQVFEVEF